MQPSNIEKVTRGNRVFLSFKMMVSAIIIFLLVINLFPVKTIEQKSFFNQKRPLVIAHQAGSC
ncbi:hypothetical protein [Neobacillus vireti]|uniref:hypothetical protein n=1 Tax=Neobacillus vireti TaxID=220686 RepID=UPI002FFFF01D